MTLNSLSRRRRRGREHLGREHRRRRGRGVTGRRRRVERGLVGNLSCLRCMTTSALKRRATARQERKLIAATHSCSTP